MDIFIIVVFALLTASNVFIYIRLQVTRRAPRDRAVLSAFLPFLIYMLCVFIFRLAVPWYVLLLGIAAQFMQTFFGYYRDAFERSTRFDRYMHAFACFAYALLAYCTLFAIFGGVISRIYAVLFIAAIGMSIGVRIEIFEFISDQWSKFPTKHQKGLKDTNIDLICDAIGSVCAAVFAHFIIL